MRGQRFAEVPADIGATIVRRAALFGLREVQVSFVHVLQTAIAIKATSDHPKRDVAHLKQRGGVAALLGRPRVDFEGTYLEVDDAAGTPAYIVGNAPRNGSTLSTDPAFGRLDTAQG